MEFHQFKSLPYVVRFPSGYQPGDRCPVLLYLHGAGTRTIGVEEMSKGPLFETLSRYEDLSFITVAPYCCEETWFDRFETLKEFVQMLVESPYTDPRRLYLLGGSMGAYAAWQLAISMPTYFAALIPICGGGMYWDAGRLTKIPIWAFHGEDDNVVKVEESIKMVEAVNAKGGNAKLTIYPQTRHNAWTPTYENREVFEWMMQQRLSETCVGKDEFANAKEFG